MISLAALVICSISLGHHLTRKDSLWSGIMIGCIILNLCFVIPKLMSVV